MKEVAFEKARELGRQLGQTEEYRALERARQRFSEDAASVEAMQRLQLLERDIAQALQAGEEPAEALTVEYEQRFGTMQGSPVYQALVAAQSNFDKILGRVNEEITKGMEAGAQSRIILPS
jgi:cell fate (sporulation/competence/biofilm development) regulator YlbF (YheA/YmcA/DUF963 family)